ncbi:MAG: hypothetical protein FWG10_12065 [Eubacteriaceae bacterium]|nr:hypothetical protein [Eubacteriaceae bacterium]
MINLFCGVNGSGKTQKLISHANNELENTLGLIVFIDNGTKKRLSVSNQIKFVDVSEYEIYSPDLFYGFLCGIVCGNYDINRIYIDNMQSTLNLAEEKDFMAFLGKVNTLSQKAGVDFYITKNEETGTNTVNELVYAV